MVTLFSFALFLLDVLNAGRQPWIEPLPPVRIEPTRPFRREEDFGPDSAYRLLRRAGEISFADFEEAEDWESLLSRCAEHPLPAKPPGPFAQGFWSARDYMAVLLVLDHAGPHLDLARQAIAAPDPQMPSVGSPDDLLPYLSPTRQLGRLFALCAYAKEAEGDFAGAMDDLLACIRLGNTVARGGCLINCLVDIAVSRIAVDAMHRIATRNDVPPETLGRAARELLWIADQIEPFAEVMRNEAQFGMRCLELVPRKGIQEIQGGRSGMGEWLAMRAAERWAGSSPATMKRDFTSLYQHLVDLAGRPYTEETSRQMRNLLGGLKPPLPDIALRKRDPVGLILAGMLVPAIGHSGVKVAERDAFLRGTALWLAILAYEKDTGAPPKALPDLVPDYLPQIPLDPFDGKPFRYRVGEVPAAWGESGWGVYSIGSDFRDDGGTAGALVSSREPGKPPRNCPDILWLPKPLPAAAARP